MGGCGDVTTPPGLAPKSRFVAGAPGLACLGLLVELLGGVTHPIH